jgi:hypothetical protein
LLRQKRRQKRAGALLQRGEDAALRVPEKERAKAGSEINSPSAQTNFASLSALARSFPAAVQAEFNSHSLYMFTQPDVISS